MQLIDLRNHIKEINTTLKPCPFCGSQADAIDFEDGMGYDKSWEFKIQCQNRNCLANFQIGFREPRMYPDSPYEETIKENINLVNKTSEKWNRRVANP
jgi:hypothetical protein